MRSRLGPEIGPALVVDARDGVLLMALVAWALRKPAGAVVALRCLAVAALLVACRTTPERPNIVLVVGDDHGYPDSGFMGNTLVRTPVLDRLAAEGTVFSTGYNTGSTCRPSLRSLLTGLHPYQWEWELWSHPSPKGREAGSRSWMPGRSLDTLPKLLARQGYASFQAGKLWDGTYRHYGFTAGTKERWPKGHRALVRMMGGLDGIAIGRTTMQPVYDFIDQHAHQPFFVWFAPLLPHLPHDPSAEHLARYDGLDLTDCARRYYANISRLDDAVGGLVDHLERRGLRSRTLIVYLTDNGWDQGPHDHYRRRDCGSGPHGKGTMYELAFRTPIIFNWPGHVPAGRVIDEVVSTVDVFTTLLDVAGVAAPATVVGQSLFPALHGSSPLRPSPVVGHGYPPATGAATYFVRTPEWHYIWAIGGPVEELYHVATDPGERRNVLAEHPDVVPGLRATIEGWKDRLNRLRGSDQSPPTPP